MAELDVQFPVCRTLFGGAGSHQQLSARLLVLFPMRGTVHRRMLEFDLCSSILLDSLFVFEDELHIMWDVPFIETVNKVA